MSYTVYILFSETLQKYYKGQTNNMDDRLRRHNAGYEKATKRGVPWKLVWSTTKETSSEARILENKLKNLNLQRLQAFIQKFADDRGSNQDVPQSGNLGSSPKPVELKKKTALFHLSLYLPINLLKPDFIIF